MDAITYKTPSQPRQVRLDTTTECQARCLSCHRFLTDRKGAMSLGQVNNIIDDIAAWPDPLNELVPVNYGEVFLYPYYKELFELLAARLPRTRIVVPTNGVRMDIAALASMPNLSVVNVSVNAAWPDTYKAFTGLNANFTSLKDKIRKLRALRPKVTVWASMVHDPVYQSDLERDAFVQMWSDVAIPQVINAASCGRNGKKVAIIRSRPCRSIFSDFVIGFDGKLSSCCFEPGFQLNLGTYSGDLRADWNGRLISNLRELHNEGQRHKIPICQSCTFE